MSKSVKNIVRITSGICEDISISVDNSKVYFPIMRSLLLGSVMSPICFDTLDATDNIIINKKGKVNE